MIQITKADYEKIIAHAKANLPEEACGLIAGSKDGDIKKIEKVYLLTNIAHTTEHFSMDPGNSLRPLRICARMV